MTAVSSAIQFVVECYIGYPPKSAQCLSFSASSVAAVVAAVRRIQLNFAFDVQRQPFGLFFNSVLLPAEIVVDETNNFVFNKPIVSLL